LLVGMAGLAPENSVLGRDFGFDGCRQRSDALPGAFVELAIDQLDPKVPLNLQNELQNIDGIDLQIASQQRLIVAQILGVLSLIRKPAIIISLSCCEMFSMAISRQA
jgi:hypothetical protein